MTPSFDKTGRLLAPEQTRKVTRGVSFKLGLPGYSSIDFFSNHSAEVPESQYVEKSEEFYRTAYAEVQQAVEEYKRNSYLTAPAEDSPSQPAAPSKPVEANPFVVSSRPSAATTDGSPTGATAVAPAKEEKIQAGRTETKETKADPAKELLSEVQGSALVTPTAPARRGRKAKDAPTEAPANTANTANTATQSPAQQANPEVDDSDIPAVMGGTHEVTPGPDMKERTREFIQAQPTQIPSNGPAPSQTPAPQNGPQLVPAAQSPGDRIKAAIGKIAAETKKDPEKVTVLVKEFFRAFMNITGPLPAPTDPAYKFAIPILESLAVQYTGNIVADPKSMGIEAGAGWNKLLRHVDKWQDPLKNMALRVAIKQYPDNGHDLLEFLEKGAKLGALDNELLVFLTTCFNFDPATGIMLKEGAAKAGKTMAAMVEGLDLATCGQGALLSRISGVAPSAAPAGGDLWPE